MKNIKIITITFICMITMLAAIKMIVKMVKYDNATNINDYEFVNHYVTPEYKSDVYEFENGAAIVINDDKNIYELFIPELGDWSYICDSKQDLFMHLNTYTNNKDNTMDWNNNDLTMSTHKYDDRIKYSLNNGIDILKYNNSYQIYIPSMNDIPYKLTDKNDVENLVLTYIEYTNK